MASPRIVSVFGATGLQGAAVVRALLKDGTFTPRAIGDWMDKASLVSAMRGSEAVFALTFPVFGPGPTQIDQGKNLVDAAKEAGVKFLSSRALGSLPSIAKISGGKYTSCVHYDQKAVVDAYLRASGLANASLHLGAFLENYWWKFGLLKKTPTGFDVAVPNYSATALQAFTWVERDVPAATLALLKSYTDPAKDVSGKSYPVVNATISYTELAARTGNGDLHQRAAHGIPPVDEMYEALAEYSGLYTATPVPNPALVALGVEFGTMEEFLETEVKPRFGV
ncbi:hypothetical protein DFH09DRAFT_1339825 [Mycena vulgaris]|nr:hypothetical protein DFH09DRAFT_1339825 [Mycena vulgaris]